MTIARAQMYRQLYQMGGIGSLPMDFGQPLEVPQQMPTNFSSAQNITMNPLLNYGQPQLGQAGGTPLTMASGGMSRLGYQEGGMGMEMMEPQMQEQDMMQPQMQQAPQIDPSQMDPKQALELIIQMLIAQGIPPEQAREIAIQMVQAVAEGGMEEMSDERVEARFGGRIGYASGGIGSLINREQYGFGSFFKGVGKAVSGAVKGVTKAVKSVVKSDIGKIALAAAAIYATGGGAAFGGPGFSLFGTAGSTAGGLLGSGGAFDLGSSYLGQGLFGATDYYGLSGSKGLLGNLGITPGFGADLLPKGISSLLPSTRDIITGGLGFGLGKLSGGEPKPEDFPDDASYQEALARWNATLSTKLNEPKPQFAKGLFPNNPFYPQTQMAANGGRIGYQEGGIGDLIQQVTKQEFFGTPMMANGGRMQYGLGDLVRGSGITRPVSSSESGGGNSSGFGGMISRLIQQNPQMFRSPQMSSSRATDFIDENQDGIDDRQQASYGGRMGYAMGAEVPTRQNEAGVTELDYRKKGGFVPPIGIKEKADDIPAMLSNNEFVFTANAVRNAGNGNVNKGAERMYGLMKQLEAGGMV